MRDKNGSRNVEKKLVSICDSEGGGGKVDRAQKLERPEECSLSTIVLDIEQR